MSSEFDEMKFRIQEGLISLIKENVEPSIIHFLDAEKRIYTDQQLAESFNIYNIFGYITYSTKRGKNPKYNIIVGKQFCENWLHYGLPTGIEPKLIAWGRNVTKLLSKYFLEKDNIYLGKIRIDLLTDDKKQNFIIPNLLLQENIYLYNNLIDANSSHKKDRELDDKLISYKKYVEDAIEDEKAQKTFEEMMKSSLKT